MKYLVAKAIGFFSFKMAKIACGSASAYGMHQPKEPEVLKNILKKK